jgi:hypothetical protein
MSSIDNKCNCTIQEQSITKQCVSCGVCDSLTKINTAITQKRMWKQVRAPASLYTMSISALANTQRIRANDPINWNQSSDQQIESQQTAYHPTRGDSTKRTLTSEKPGSQAPGGKGVDIKHNSYARYLNRLKAGNIRTQSNQVAKPLFGNKVKTYGMINNSENCCSV